MKRHMPPMVYVSYSADRHILYTTAPAAFRGRRLRRGSCSTAARVYARGGVEVDAVADSANARGDEALPRAAG